MNLEIKTIDNFFPLILQREIIEMFHDVNFTWHYSKNIAYSNKENLPWKKYGQIQEIGAFSKKISTDHHYYERLSKNIKTFTLKKFDVKIEKILRLLVTFMPPNPLYPDDHVPSPHVDDIKPHKNMLYYILDNDADTIFFNQKYTAHDEIDFSNKEIIHRITPKQGRAVMFDGSIYHSGTVSKFYNRLVLNINFI